MIKHSNVNVDKVKLGSQMKITFDATWCNHDDKEYNNNCLCAYLKRLAY